MLLSCIFAVLQLFFFFELVLQSSLYVMYPGYESSHLACNSCFGSAAPGQAGKAGLRAQLLN
jgi:hypothetical protein